MTDLWFGQINSEMYYAVEDYCFQDLLDLTKFDTHCDKKITQFTTS